VQARKVGLRAYERARPSLRHITLSSCGAQGLLLQERAAAALDRCTISGCGEEGAVAAGEAQAELAGCVVERCGGPAVDASGQAYVRLTGCDLRGCVGGLWMWDAAVAHVEGTRVASDGSYAVLMDSRASSTSGGGNHVDGLAFVAEADGAPAPCKLAAAAAAAAAASSAARDDAAADGEWREGRGKGAGAGGGAAGACLVQAGMLPPDARAAAAAFPPEVEPFVFKPSPFRV
jgi:hypothetical protein